MLDPWEFWEKAGDSLTGEAVKRFIELTVKTPAISSEAYDSSDATDMESQINPSLCDSRQTSRNESTNYLIKADSIRLLQVVRNLLINVFKMSGEGTAISLIGTI